MTVPSEIAAVVRAAAATVKARRALLRAVDDEASEKVLAKYRAALDAALEAQERALSKAAELARRPNAPIDWTVVLNGVVRTVEALRSGDVERALRDRVRGVIDVKSEP